MKTHRIDTYKQFVNDGYHYYPRVEAGVLILPNFSTRAKNAVGHHRRLLICESHVIYNRKGFAAIHYEWYSLYGLRQRWFYFRDGIRVTYRQLTWDEKETVCRAFWRYGSNSMWHTFALCPSKQAARYVSKHGGLS